MRTLYFKVWLGYEKFISITDDELEKALAAHISGGIALLGNGSVSGKSITLIEPDYHRAMGFTEGYKLTPEDWKMIDRDCSEYKGYIGGVKENVQKMLAEGKVTKSKSKPIELPKPKITGHMEEREDGRRVYVVDSPKTEPVQKVLTVPKNYKD